MRKLALILAVGTGPALGQQYFVDGNRLLSECTVNTDLCIGYIAAFHDTLSLLQDGKMSGTEQFILNQSLRICPPPEATIDQLRRVVVKHLENNPSQLHHTASFQVQNAVSDAFPCE